MRNLRKSLTVISTVVILSGCQAISNKFDEWGQSMPTHNDAWCEGWFCWNDTTTKAEAFRPQNNPPVGSNMNPMQKQGMVDNEAAMEQMMMNGQQQPAQMQVQPQQQQMPDDAMYNAEQEDRMAKELGIPSPDKAFGGFNGEAPQAPVQPGAAAKGKPDTPWKSVPPKPKKNQFNTDNRLPREFDEEGNMPPGAVKGENWPPKPPEFEEEEDPLGPNPAEGMTW